MTDGEYFKGVPVTITLFDTQEVHLEEENTITAAELFPAIKTLKAADCDEIRPEMLKPWTKKVLLAQEWQKRIH